MMTVERSTGREAEALERTRDFDYGIDDACVLEARIRAQIAARIREAGRLEARATSHDQFAYDRAAQIAERLER